MNSTGRPSTPLALMSLEKSSAARLAWIPYCAYAPESAAGIPILMGVCAHARRRYAGTPRLTPRPPATATCRKSRLLITDPPLALDGEASVCQDWDTHRIDDTSPSSRHSLRQDSPPSSLR